MKNRYKSLADYLASTGQTQEGLALALGIGQSQISNYVAGRSMPRPALALQIAEHTGVPVEALLRARVEGVAS
jgi:transcriptional regulator with XRE-family HTH domain